MPAVSARDTASIGALKCLLLHGWSDAILINHQRLDKGCATVLYITTALECKHHPMLYEPRGLLAYSFSRRVMCKYAMFTQGALNGSVKNTELEL